jgi:hypothetical protein
MSNECFEQLKKTYSQAYSREAWVKREKLFVQCCRSSDIGFDMEPFKMKELLCKLDTIFTQAKLDLAVVSKKLGRYLYQLDEKIKLNGLDARKTGIVKNEISAKAYAIKTIKEAKDDNGKTLYDYRNLYNERNIFLNHVVDLVKMKKEMLITESALLKLEASLIE